MFFIIKWLEWIQQTHQNVKTALKNSSFGEPGSEHPGPRLRLPPMTPCTQHVWPKPTARCLAGFSLRNRILNSPGGSLCWAPPHPEDPAEVVQALWCLPKEVFRACSSGGDPGEYPGHARPTLESSHTSWKRCLDLPAQAVVVPQPDSRTTGRWMDGTANILRLCLQLNLAISSAHLWTFSIVWNILAQLIWIWS